MKILLVDGQIFQTEARDRGMGRYSARLVKSIIEQGYYDEVQVILAKSGHTNHLSDQAALRIFPDTKVVHLGLSSTLKAKIDQVKVKNKQVIDDYIEQSIDSSAEVHFLVPSPFQEPVVSVYPDRSKKIVVFYDLIPYLYHTRYQLLMPFEDYLKRFYLLFSADLILSISQSVRDDLITYLGLPQERIATIDGAAIRSDLEPVKPVEIEIPPKYILMPTSDDPRKNNLRAVVGFEEFRSQQSGDYKLIITSKIHESERRRLGLFSKNIIFTGNIKEEELDWLYAHAESILFVPESEGLGLPILEAVHAAKRVVCSDLNVFKEISQKVFYYCDHEDQHAIAEALIRAQQESTGRMPIEEYDRILDHYSWARTGQRAVDAIISTPSREPTEKMKIAIFTPKPDGLSAVGKVVAEGHAALSEVFDIDYYAERGTHNGSTRPNFLRYVSRYFDATLFGVEQYAQYDAVFYHVGNSDYHIMSITNGLYLPGYTILHDTNIGEAYRIMVEQDMISSERYEAERQVDELLETKNSSFLSSVLHAQSGMIAHSRYALDAAYQCGAEEEGSIEAQLPTNVPSMGRERSYAQPVIGLAGILADIKGVQVIEKLAAQDGFKEIKFKLFGYNFTSGDTLDRLSAYDNISVSTNLTDFDFQSSMSKLDIFVNYRLKYQGEASLSTIEAMRHGVVVIVRNVGWYAELPDDAVIKVEDQDEVETVIKNLFENPDRLRAISISAKEYVRKHHTHAAYVAAMKKLVLAQGNNNNADMVTALKAGTMKRAQDMLSVVKHQKGQ